MLDLIDRAFDRRRREAADGDAAEFARLVENGELLTKLIGLSLCALLDPDRGGSEHAYRAEFELVRALGVGGWVFQVQELATGHSASTYEPQASALVRQLTEKVRPGGQDAWQFAATQLLSQAAKSIGINRPVNGRANLLLWLDILRDIRNKDAHGSTSTSQFRDAVGPLRDSLEVIAENLALLQLPTYVSWRTGSGERRSACISDCPAETEPGDEIASSGSPTVLMLTPGGRWRPIALLHTTSDRSDYWLANGDFRDRDFRYEGLSYLTGDRRLFPGDAWATPPIALRPSETDGLLELEVVGEVLSNLPPRKSDYIARPDVEPELRERLLDPEEDPIVTLGGMGGIGKTSTALAVLHEMAALPSTYDVILWFSSRDVDLLPSGPDSVAPQVSTLTQMADYAVTLMRPYLDVDVFATHSDAFRSMMRGDTFEGRVLFVFDNFETVHNPGEAYRQLKASVRLPNKALITTRHDEFRGHYPIDVPRMPYALFTELISATASRLNLVTMLQGQESWIQDVYKESFGHPYIVRIVLGEARRRGRLGAVERTIANQDEVLRALFRRTFNNLSEPAKRCMLLLCTWRSTIPLVALEAVITRPGNPLIDVPAAVSELQDLSLLEIISGDIALINVPQSSFQYVRQFEWPDSVYHQEIAVDAEYLRLTGVQNLQSTTAGFRLDPFAQSAAGRSDLDAASVKHIIDHLAEACPGGWLAAFDYYEGVGELMKAREALLAARRQAGMSPKNLESLLSVYRRLGDPRQFDLATELADIYISSRDWDSFRLLTRRLAESVASGGAGDHPTRLQQFLERWRSHEKMAYEIDAEALAAMYGTIRGEADERRRWRAIADERKRSARPVAER